MTESGALNKVVLFDGECGMCSAFVRFVLTHSTDPTIVFISLQSERGRLILDKFGIDPKVTDSIVVVSNGRALIYSSAIIELVRSFRFPWNVLRCLAIVPSVILDIGYRIVARYRKRFFPPPAECSILSPDERARIHIE